MRCVPVAAVVLLALLAATTGMATAASVAATTDAPAASQDDGDGGTPGDAPDDRTDAQSLATEETVNGTLADGDDVDWYAVDVAAGEAVVATLALTNATENQSVRLDLYDESGQLATETEEDKMSGPRWVAGESPGSQVRPVAHAPDVAEYDGTYYVRVAESRWNETAENESTPYNLTVETDALDQHDPNENGSMATPLELGETFEGVVAPFDHDVYAVSLEEGRNYTVTFNYTSDPYRGYVKQLRFAADPATITDDDEREGEIITEFTRNRTATFTAPESGTHYIRLGQSGITATLLERNDYRLTVVATDSESGSEDGETPPQDGDESGDGTDDDGSTDDGSDGDADEPMPTPTDEPAGEEPADDGPDDTATAETTPERAGETDGPGDRDPTASPPEDDEQLSPSDTDTADGNVGDEASPTERAGAGTPSPSASPTSNAGPGFGLAAALAGLLGLAGLAARRDRRSR